MPQNTIYHILKQLKSNGIHSILLEGGPITLSSFLKEDAVDMLQLHIAPLIFGSGKSAFGLDEIQKVSQGLKLNNLTYHQMDDAMMVTGFLRASYSEQPS